jgi:AcrR family transcriptional regulator
VKNSISLFKEKGFNSTSILEIARATGLTKGSIYNHYRSKEDILKKVIEVVESNFFEYIKINDNTDINEILQLTAQFFLDNECCLMANLMCENLSENSRQNLVVFFRNWENKIAQAMADAIPEDQKHAFAQDVIVLFEGGIMLKRVMNNNQIINRYHDELRAKYKQLVTTYTS